MTQDELTPERIRKSLTQLIEAIDNGEIETDSREFELIMLAAAGQACDYGCFDLIPQLAMRTEAGRSVMQKRGMLH